MSEQVRLSPWWKNSLILTVVTGFTILIWLAVRTDQDAPPIPDRVLTPTGEALLTRSDILAGQQVFLKYGLMENGTIWGHGAYLGPDFSAEYLHTLAEDAADSVGKKQYGRGRPELTSAQRVAVDAEVQRLLKENRYDSQARTLVFTDAETESYVRQGSKWAQYLSDSKQRGGLPPHYISDPEEQRQLIAFFAWTAWASVANRPGRPSSYTNNFPYDPQVGNTAPGEAVLWSALSLITLLGATALALFVVGRFDFLGWKGRSGHIMGLQYACYSPEILVHSFWRLPDQTPPPSRLS